MRPRCWDQVVSVSSLAMERFQEVGGQGEHLLHSGRENGDTIHSVWWVLGKCGMEQDLPIRHVLGQLERRILRAHGSGSGSRVPLLSNCARLPKSCARHHSTFPVSHWPWLTMYEAGASQRCRICLTKSMGSSGTNEEACANIEEGQQH